MKRLNRQKGFTLVETVVTIFIFGVVMLGTSLMLRDILVNNRQQYKVLDSTDQARRVANAFATEIRNATYGANGSYPLNEATNNQITFFSTTQNSTNISKIRYYVSGNVLYKGVTKPAGSPLSYTGQPETITTLIPKMSLGGNPLFYYYDGNYNGSGNALATPPNLNQVKFIKINLTILKQLTPTSTTTFTVTAGASMRNLKTNLGN